jgi:hypothetical protein
VEIILPKKGSGTISRKKDTRDHMSSGTDGNNLN